MTITISVGMTPWSFLTKNKKEERFLGVFRGLGVDTWGEW